MGNYYTNVTIRAGLQEVRHSLERLGRTAYVCADSSGLAVICDRDSDTADLDALASLSHTLSLRLESPSLAVSNHHDDVVMFGLYNGGGLLAEFGWSNSRAWQVPKTNRREFIQIVQSAFGSAARPRINVVQAAMGGKSLGVKGWLLNQLAPRFFGVAVHDQLAAAMGMPVASVGAGFRYVEGGDFREHNFVRIR